MRVLHVYAGNLYGGIEAILVAVARGAGPASTVRHEFALALEGRLSRELAAAAARVHVVGPVRASRPHTVAAARWRLDGLLADGRFDRVVCHAPWSQALFGGVARRAGVPLVFWAHDAMRGRHWTERLARRVRPDLVICNSEFTAATLPRLYPDVHHLVVYAPVATSPRGIDNEERQRLRAALETAGEATVLVQASRSEPWKGHETLVAALTRLRAMPGWIWWQVGGAQRPAEARFLARLREQAERCGIADRVRWVGERPDVPRLLAAADIYCQANVMPEPFGVVFVEALAAGLPVVSTRLGGVREIVDDTCGVLVPPADPAALADALGELIVDATRRRALARQAAARAKRLCDPPTQLQRLESALHAMVPAAISA